MFKTKKELIRKYFFISFIIFIFSGYIIPKTPLWSIIFYIIVAPLSVYLIISEEKFRKKLPQDHSLLIAIMCLFWFSSTLIWGIYQPDNIIQKYILRSITNIIFLGSAVYFFYKSDQTTLNMFEKCILTASSISIIISIILFYNIDGRDISTRLHGIGQTSHPILGSLSLFLPLCISLKNLSKSTSAREKLIYIIPVTLIITFTLLTESRGPLLAMTSILAIYIASNKIKYLFYAAIISVCACVIIYNYEPLYDAILNSITRKPWRFEIWKDAFEYIKESPLIGNGIASRRLFGGEAKLTFPHSIYVSAAFYGGFIGLFLLITLYVSLLIKAWKALKTENKTFYLTLLCISMIGGLTDLGQIITSPSELWYIFWIPVCLIIGRTMADKKAELQSTP